MLKFFFGKRSHFLINPPFQIRFIGVICSFSLIGIAVLFFANYFFFDHMVKEGISMGLEKEHSYFYFISEQRAFLTKIFLITSIVLFGLIFIFGMFYSHKIAGPLYNMNIQLNRLAKGEKLHQLRFRKGDYFKELAISFNRVRKYIESISSDKDNR